MLPLELPTLQTWEVYGLIDGAVDSDTNYCTTVDDAESSALELATDYATDLGMMAKWEVYILPHYCGLGGDEIVDEDSECSCVEHLTTHGARYTWRDRANLLDSIREDD